MRISETLKKAAGLLVEFDEPTAEEEFYRTMKQAEKQNEQAAPAPQPRAAAPAPQPAPSRPSIPNPAPTPAPAAPKTVEQVVRDAPGPNLDEIKVTAAAAAPVVDANGVVNYGSIYQLASLPVSPFTAEQVLDLLATLPGELPIETKRATVKVTLNAMGASLGVTSETIVADASRKLAALAAYAQSFVHQVDEYASKAEGEIAALEAEIAKRRSSVAEAKAKQARICEACTAESDRLDDVLEFFSLDVAPSKYAPGK